MKKFSAIVISAILIISLSVSVSALADISGVSKKGYTAYPLFDEYGEYTEGVTIYLDNKAVTGEAISERMGKNWDANSFKDTDGSYQMLVWSGADFFAFGRGVRMCRAVETDYIEIVFTGTGFRLGTCYRTTTGTFVNNAIKIVIDGEEVATDPDLLHADWEDDTTPTIIYEIGGLENETHTVKIYSANSESHDFECDWFEIRGTLGANTAGDTYVEESEIPTESKAPETDPPATEKPTSSDKPKTEKPVSTDAPTTDAPGTDDDSSFSIWIPIAAVAAAAAVIVVVVIILKKKKATK